jgi:hypothetical protein
MLNFTVVLMAALQRVIAALMKIPLPSMVKT